MAGTLLERIIAYGAAGSGKSFAWLSTAKWLHDAGAPVHFHCIDTDAAIERMLSVGFSGLSNVTVYNCYDWPELVDATKRLVAVAKPGDWLVVDMIDKAWEYVQAYFTEQVHGEDIGEFFLRARIAIQNEKGSKDGAPINPFDGWTDWQFINRLYKSWVQKALYGNGGLHVYATAPIKEVAKDASRDIKATYGVLGIYPAGQKSLSHQFHTILLMAQPTNGEWTMTSVKDRERQQFNRERVILFPYTYLMPVAGYNPTQGAGNDSG